jgi:hypothetical protein
MQRTLETAQTAEVEAAEAGVEGVAEEGVVTETEHNRKVRVLRNLSPHSNLLLLASWVVAWSRMPRARKVKKTMTRICALSVPRISTTTV